MKKLIASFAVVAIITLAHDNIDLAHLPVIDSSVVQLSEALSL